MLLLRKITFMAYLLGQIFGKWAKLYRNEGKQSVILKIEWHRLQSKRIVSVCGAFGASGLNENNNTE